MPRHTNNAALNEAAQRERERLRKEADSKESDLLLIAYLQGREEAADKYRDRIICRHIRAAIECHWINDHKGE